MSAGSSICCTFSPCMLRTSAFISVIPVMQRLLLASLVDNDDAALAAGDCAMDADQVALGIDHDDLEVLGRDPVAAEMTGASRTAIDAAWRGAGGVRAGSAVAVGGAVGGVHAMEMMALDDTGEALALAHTDHIDMLADGECRDGDRVTDLDFRVLGPEFAKEAQRGDLVGGQ